MTQTSRPDGRLRVVIVAGRGEVLRNFLFSDTLSRLAEEAEVTVLSVVTGEDFVSHFEKYTTRVIPLKPVAQPRLALYLRILVENAHDRWLWSTTAQNQWAMRDLRAKKRGSLWRRRLMKTVARALAFRPILRVLTAVEQELAYRLSATDDFETLFSDLRPHLVFNGSHIHGPAADLPMRVAHRMGIRTAGFLFSWDNLTSRSRIFVPYDDVLAWSEGIRRQYLSIYSHFASDRVYAVGTPQFDYHFKNEHILPREELARRIGIDPQRPYVLYTTGIDNHFFEEHRHVERVAELLQAIDIDPKPQLVVRTYVKGTSDEMHALAAKGMADVVFPPTLWSHDWETPRYEDADLYISLLYHSALGINAASTVSLELMIFDKPIINLRYDPPGTDLPWILGFERHILFDHFLPVAASGATMVATSDDDMAAMLHRGLSDPGLDSEKRQNFLQSFFGDLCDGQAGTRVAELLLRLAEEEKTRARR
jgi:hypothetical protein